MPPIRNNNMSDLDSINKNPFPVSNKTNEINSPIDPIMNFGIALFIISIIMSSGIFAYHYKLSQDIIMRESEIKNLALQVNGISFKDINSFYLRYKNTMEKEQNKNMIEGALDYLSYVVVPGVYFTNFDFKTTSEPGVANVEVAGVATSLERAIKQMDSFKTSDYNKNILITEPNSDSIKMEAFNEDNNYYKFTIKFKVKSNVSQLLKSWDTAQEEVVPDTELNSLIFKDKAKALDISSSTIISSEPLYITNSTTSDLFIATSSSIIPSIAD